jgi:hypothetical protein
MQSLAERAFVIQMLPSKQLSQVLSPLPGIEIILILCYNVNMSYSSSWTFETFTASELAPQAEEFRKLETRDAEEILIGNHVGNIVLKISELGSKIKLDDSVQPPVIIFNYARVASELGTTDENGVFTRFNNNLGFRWTIVNGIYQGPSSELEVA